MVSAILKNYLLLENKECFNYTSIAYDEKYFYICVKNKCSIIKSGLNGHIVDVIKTQSVYKSICFDSRENCFWTIKNNCPQYIFKLDKELKEVDSFISKEVSYDCINNISYRASDDTLLLSSSNFIYNVSKQGETLFKYQSNNNHLILSIGEISKNLIKCTNYMPESLIVINMFYSGCCGENLNCIPNGYKPISIFPSCYGADNNDFYIGTIKNKQFTYLLKYELVSICEHETSSKIEIQHTKHFEDDDFVCINDISVF